jgi:hypothetical protein
MVEDPSWEVDLYVDGPVALRRRISTIHQKGFHPANPFYSDVQIQGVPSGLQATITARAPNERLAFEAAVFFFGRMLDVLSLTVDRPLYLSFTERRRIRDGPVQQDIRRIIEPQEIEQAFHKAHELATTSPSAKDAAHTPSFLKSLGWYRKGLYSEDPFDKFLAFWNAIEIVASRYYRDVPGIDLERARKGIRNQVLGCFMALWGPCEQWPIIPGNAQWVDENYETRNDIAHGAGAVDIGKVASIAASLDTIRQVSHRFLHDWQDKFLRVGRQPRREYAGELEGE